MNHDIKGDRCTHIFHNGSFILYDIHIFKQGRNNTKVDRTILCPLKYSIFCCIPIFYFLTNYTQSIIPSECLKIYILYELLHIHFFINMILKIFYVLKLIAYLNMAWFRSIRIFPKLFLDTINNWRAYMIQHSMNT